MASRTTFGLTLALVLMATPVMAQELRVEPGQSLQQAIVLAKPGDVLRVGRGTYKGVTVVTVPNLTLIGEDQPTLDGEGRGSVVLVRSPGVTLRGFRITGSGTSPFGEDSGVQVLDAPGAIVEDSVFDRVFMGVRLKASPGSIVRRNQIKGDSPKGRFNDWGDGVRIWNSPGCEVNDNQIGSFRDGVYLEFSHKTRISRNQVLNNQRYGLHFMYCDGGLFQGNRFEANQAGSVLMYSKRIRVENNLFSENRGSIGQGLLFKENDESVVRNNRIFNNTVGMFVDGSNRNQIERNVFAGNGWGLLLFSSSVGNTFRDNAFYSNNYEVAVDARQSRNDFAGNYWSGYRGYDLNGDGRGDVPYAPVTMFAYLAMQYPDLYAFIGSPAVKALEFAQRVIPALCPSDLRDPAPHMIAPRKPA